MPVIDDINRYTLSSVKAVAFDIGGVLIRINRRWEHALRDCGIRNSVTGGLDEAPNFIAFQRGEISEDDYAEALRDFLRVNSREEALDVHNHIIKEPYEGTLELVESLRSFGVVTACLSNTNTPHWQEMTQSGRFPSIESLDHHAVSHILHLEKPDPAIYHAFEDMVGARPGEIVFFDDSEDNVEAAREVGWRAYWIDHTGDTAEQMELILISHSALPPP